MEANATVGVCPLRRPASLLLALLVAVAVPASALAGDPPSNIPPLPNFDEPCVEQNGLVTQGYCGYDPTTGQWMALTPAREQAALEAINHARALEGQEPLVLPANFATLNNVDQQFVLANLERIAAGLPPLVAVSPALNAAAVLGAQANTDPTPPSSLAGWAYGANWAGDLQPAVATYGYMYLDGWGGSQNTPNLDCTGPTAPGCWGHRHVMLGSYGSTGLFGAAALPGGPSGDGSSAQLYLNWTGGPLPVSYIWAQALAAGAAGGLGAAPTADPLWPFQDMGGDAWAAGAAATLHQVGVVQGTSLVTFSPSAPVETQEMVTFLGRVLDWPPDSGAAPAGTASWAAGFMGQAQALGLLPPGLGPTAPLSRLQTVSLVVSALGLPPAQTAMPFQDLGGLSAADLQVLTTAVADGLIQGEGGGILDPRGGLDRAQAVLILQRALLLLAREGRGQANGTSLQAQAAGAGSELYTLGSLHLLASGAQQDPFLYWISAGSGPERLLVLSGGFWWSGQANLQPEALPSWAPQATLYARARALLWPAGQEGVGPALFGPTVMLIRFGSEVKALLPGASSWVLTGAAAAADPALAVALALGWAGGTST